MSTTDDGEDKRAQHDRALLPNPRRPRHRRMWISLGALEHAAAHAPSLALGGNGSLDLGRPDQRHRRGHPRRSSRRASDLRHHQTRQA